jgi:hypothetical protein
MAAGDGAAEQSRLAAERVARLRRQLNQAERAEKAWAAGAAGEAQVAQKLDELAAHGWHVLHDVRWPGRPKANLDHVLVGPGGVIVVDAKNWTGDVQIRGDVLRQNGFSREREVAGVLQQCAAVAALLEPQHRRFVQAWLCTVGQPLLQGVALGTRIQGLDTVNQAVLGLPAVLDPETVPVIHNYLYGLLSGSKSPRLLTTQNFLAAETPSHRQYAGSAESLEKWRAAPRANPAPPGHSLDARRRNKRRAKSKGCLATLFYLGCIIFLLGIFVNVMPHSRQQAPAVPSPSPSVVKTVPTR